MALAASPRIAGARLPRIRSENYDDEQRKASEAFLAARKTSVFGPFEPMMHSPQLMSLTRATGDYLRYGSSIGNVLSEFTILIIAREWSQDFEWSVHYPIALDAGISKGIADAIADGRRPIGMSSDEETVHDFISELLRTRRVSDETFARAERRFGTRGVVDLTGICGYYSFLAMQLNVARYPAVNEAQKLSRFPD
jgi:4-carboxymuconolactone decarboxylase